MASSVAHTGTGETPRSTLVTAHLLVARKKECRFDLGVGNLPVKKTCSDD
jgi:hypothetical protein